MGDRGGIIGRSNREGRSTVKRKGVLVVGLVAVMALLLGACGDDNKPSAGGTQSPAGCRTYTKASALSLKRPRIAMAGVINALRPQSKPTVKIGFIGDLTGKNSSLVVASRDALVLAVEQANAKGDLPVKVETVILDNKDANEGPAAQLAQQLINDKEVVAVMGPAFSGETSVATPLFCRAGIVNVTQSATRVDLTKQGWQTFFRSVGGDLDQAQAAAKLMIGRGYKKIALVNDKSPYGEGLAQGIGVELKKDSSVQVVLEEGVAPTTNYTSLVDSLLAKQPDAVYYGGYVAEAPLVLKQMRNKGLKAAFLSGDGSKEDKFITTAGASIANGVEFTCACLDPAVSTEADAKKFSADFIAKFGHKAGIYGAEGWDVTQMFLSAFKAGKTSRADVLKYITDLKDYKGLTKTFNWTTDSSALHEVTDKGVNIYKIEGGKIVLLGNINEVIK
jgi:branched-chain amino acid transport system substrate-binding protein